MEGSSAALVLPVLALLLACGGVAEADPQVRCAFTDSRLDEVSGLAWSPEGLWAVNDSGNASTLDRLDDECEVAATRAVPIGGRDVEDLARTADGAFWLADTGDNNRVRPTVAILRVPPRGGEISDRLVYPDGPHDAEALLVAADGRPLIVTKEVGGRSGVYAPDAPLGPAPAVDPAPMRRVGEVLVPPSDTVSAGDVRVSALGSGLVTGGAIAADARTVVLRTYTDAWVYSAPGGDVLAALGTAPRRVPLGGEPQGEAITVSPDGTLFSASESPAGGPPGALRAVPGAIPPAIPRAIPPAVNGAPVPPASVNAAARPAPEEDGTSRTWTVLAVGAAVIGGVVVLVGGRRRRS